MNKKGFTLVELMVVIVIIGILAAVAAPRLSDNINSARCNEVPKQFKKIMDKAVEYEASAGNWPADGAADAVLDVNVSSQFWTYAVSSDAAGVFKISAKVASGKKIGAVTDADSVTVNNLGAKTYTHDDLAGKYMKAYLNGATKG